MRWKNVVILVAAVLVINLPELSSALQAHRVSSTGRDVQAGVVSTRVLDGHRFVSFRVPAGSPRVGDRGFTGTARVDQRTYDAARSAGRIDVRVLPGSTTAWRADGEIRSRSGLVLTVAADVILAMIVIIYVRFRSHLRPTLVLMAEQDLEPAPPGPVLDRIAGQRYVVCGQVHEVTDDGVVLDLGDRRIKVVLGGHRNPAGLAEPVRATGTMIA